MKFSPMWNSEEDHITLDLLYVTIPYIATDRLVIYKYIKLEHIDKHYSTFQ